jgi:hypothetical protein
VALAIFTCMVREQGTGKTELIPTESCSKIKYYSYIGDNYW